MLDPDRLIVKSNGPDQFNDPPRVSEIIRATN
jgi:hypothetical protein